MKWAIQAHAQDVAEGQKIIMSNLEHLIENSLMAMERCYGYDDWCEHIKDDPNWDNIWVSIEDLWTICQYVIYTWCAMRCEECKGSDCVECKHKNSDVCNDCKRMWIHKDDKFELNLNTDTSDAIKEAFKRCEEFIENSTPEELQAYEESLGINPDDYKSSEQEKEALSADRHTRLTNAKWKDFLSEQFGISKTSAKEMLHAMMSVKREDNFKKQFSGRKG